MYEFQYYYGKNDRNVSVKKKQFARQSQNNKTFQI